MDRISSNYYPMEGFSMELDITQESKKISVSEREKNISIVKTNYRYWNSMSNFKSSNNYDDDNFRKIVQMGEDAIPGIFEIIKDHPDPIVHALDLILPNHVEYEGLVSLEDVCRIWIITLIAIGKH